MNIKSVKKGFTLTELIIVIVIIGILAGVLIPTFINVVNKANKAADISLIRNLNEALTLDRYDRGDHNTMTDALEAAEEYGYDVAKISAKVSKNEILWDSQNDVFCYLNNGEIEYYPQSVKDGDEIHPDDDNENYLLWIIDDVVNSKFSTYYYSNSEEVVPSINVSNVGFDVGKANIGVINYEGNKNHTVVIRTNGGKLTIDALTDNVHHYGKATLVDIKAVRTSSYHEFGQVVSAQIKTGRIVIENNKSSIESLLLIAKSFTEGFDDIIVETKEGAELPTLDRTDVQIADSGTLVVNVVTPESDEYIYLTKAGVVEQIVVKESSEIPEQTKPNEVVVSSSQANVSEKSETTQAAAEQVANVGKKNDDGDYVDSNNNVIIYANGTVVEGKDPSNIATETKTSQEDLNKGTTLFAGGAGVSVSPYLIANLNQFNLLDDKENNALVYENKYFKLINDIVIDVKDYNDSSNSTSINHYYLEEFVGSIDGDGNKIIINNSTSLNLSNENPDYSFAIFEKVSGTIKNLVIENNTVSVLPIVHGKKQEAKVIFDHVDYGYEGINRLLRFNNKNTGCYLTCIKSSVDFIECSNYYDLEDALTGKTHGIFVGGYVTATSPITINFTNCKNYGEVFADQFGILVGNAQNSNYGKTTPEKMTININGFENHNRVIVSNGIGIFGCDNNATADNLTYTGSNLVNILNDSNLNIWHVGGNGASNSKLMFSPAAQDADEYVLTFYEQVYYGTNQNDHDNSRAMGITVDVRISKEELLAGTEVVLSNNKTAYDLGYKWYGGFVSYRGWLKTNSAPDSSKWKESSSGLRFFFDDIGESVVIDFAEYWNTYKQSHNISSEYDYIDSVPAILVTRIYAYKNGELIACVTLPADGSETEHFAQILNN